MKLKILVCIWTAAIAALPASAGIPIGNSALTRSEQERSNDLCKQVRTMQADELRRTATPKDAKEKEMIEAIASMYAFIGCSLNGQPPSFWQCALDEQKKSGSFDGALDRCTEQDKK